MKRCPFRKTDRAGDHPVKLNKPYSDSVSQFFSITYIIYIKINGRESKRMTIREKERTKTRGDGVKIGQEERMGSKHVRRMYVKGHKEAFVLYH